MADRTFGLGLRVVPYEKHHIDGVVALWQEQYEGEDLARRRLVFDWLTEQNPFANGHAPYYLLMQDDRVVGMHGHMPLLFQVGARAQPGHLAHDDRLASELRGKGLGKVLLQGAAAQAPAFAGALWFNEPNYRLYQKSGWLDVPGLYPLLRIIDPTPFVRRRVRSRALSLPLGLAARLALKVRHPWRLRRSGRELEISPVERFDERFDELFGEVAPQLGVVVVRRSVYLNWKFVEKPGASYRILGAFDGAGRLRGYVVFRLERAGAGADGEGGVCGKILDILAPPAELEVFSDLITAGTEALAAGRATHIEIVTSYPPFLAALQKLGFVRARRPQRFLVCNWRGRFDERAVGDVSRWYLTYSDADGDAWEPSSPV